MKDPYRILDTAPEVEFDDLVALAAELCDTPIALISILDERRQWFKARVGLGVTETPIEQAFCRYAVQQQEIMEVPDAAEDPRFRNNQLVLGEPHIRFYAGAPLRVSSGEALGTICVIDREPRELKPAQRDGLQALARQVSALLELRLKSYALESRSHQLENLARAAPAVMLKVTMVDGQPPRLDYVSAGASELLGLEPAELLRSPRILWELLGGQGQEVIVQNWVEASRNGGSIEWQGWVEVARGPRWFEALARSSQQEGTAVVWDVIALDLTKRKMSEEAAVRARTEMQKLTEKLQRAEEDERRRIATGIHDDVGQCLAALKLKLAALTRVSDESVRSDGITECLDVVSSLIQKTRSLTFELSSPVLSELGLVAALETLLEKLCGEYEMAYAFSGPTEDLLISEQATFILYRSTRELINNAIRHSKGTEVGLHVSRREEGVCIRVQDDGVGIEMSGLEDCSDTGSGFGLFHVREQMQFLGGSCKAHTPRGGGAVFELWVPGIDETSA